MSGHIESFDERKDSVKKRLEDLKKEIGVDGLQKEARELDLSAADPDAAKQAEKEAANKVKREALHTRVKTLKEAMAEKAAEWQEYFEADTDATTNDEVDATVDTLMNMLDVRVEKILVNNVPPADLRAELTELKTDVDGAKAHLDPAIDDVIQAAAGSTIKPKTIDDIATPAEIAALEEGMSGGIMQKISPMFKAMLGFKKSFASIQKMMCGTDQACKQDVDKGIKDLQEQFDAMHGSKELRKMFTKALKHEGISVVQGRSDGIAFVRFLEKVEELQQKNPRATRKQLVKEMAREYVAEAKAAGAPEQVTTLMSILEGRETIVSQTVDLLEGEETALTGGHTIAIAKGGKSVTFGNGTDSMTRTLTAKGVKKAEITQASYDAGSQQLVLVFAGGLEQEVHTGAAAVDAFVAKAMADTIVYKGTRSVMFGMKEVEYEITLG